MALNPFLVFQYVFPVEETFMSVFFQTSLVLLYLTSFINQLLSSSSPLSAASYQTVSGISYSSIICENSVIVVSNCWCHKWLCLFVSQPFKLGNILCCVVKLCPWEGSWKMDSPLHTCQLFMCLHHLIILVYHLAQLYPDTILGSDPVVHPSGDSANGNHENRTAWKPKRWAEKCTMHWPNMNTILMISAIYFDQAQFKLVEPVAVQFITAQLQTRANLVAYHILCSSWGL